MLYVGTCRRTVLRPRSQCSASTNIARRPPEGPLRLRIARPMVGERPVRQERLSGVGPCLCTRSMGSREKAAPSYLRRFPRGDDPPDRLYQTSLFSPAHQDE